MLASSNQWKPCTKPVIPGVTQSQCFPVSSQYGSLEESCGLDAGPQAVPTLCFQKAGSGFLRHMQAAGGRVLLWKTFRVPEGTGQTLTAGTPHERTNAPQSGAQHPQNSGLTGDVQPPLPASLFSLSGRRGPPGRHGAFLSPFPTRSQFSVKGHQ